MPFEPVTPVDFENNPIFPLQQGDILSVTGTELLRLERTFTRPNDTTQYTAGDVVGPIAGSALISFSVPLSGYIVGLALIDSVNAATLMQPEIQIYDASPGQGQADNAAWTAEDISERNWVGAVSLANSFVGGATAGSGQSTRFKADNLNIAYGPSNALHFLIITRNAYTPAALETFTLRAWIQRP